MLLEKGGGVDCGGSRVFAAGTATTGASCRAVARIDGCEELWPAALYQTFEGGRTGTEDGDIHLDSRPDGEHRRVPRLIKILGHRVDEDQAECGDEASADQS